MEDSSSGEPPLCPCGFWGSDKTLGLCSKCYQDLVRGSPVSCTQTKAGRSSKMDSNSKHCPSRSSADNLSKQPTCAEDQKDPATLPTSCATSSTAEDRTPSPGVEASGNRQSAAPSCGMEEIAASMTEGAAVVGKKGKEDSVAIPTLQTVDRTGGPSELSTASSGPPPSVGGESCANERLSGSDVPSPQAVASGSDKKSVDTKDEASALAAQSQPETTARGTKRSHDEMEKEEAGTPSPVKQKNKKRCFKCSCKLELAQREIGRCRCDRVFCSLHRLPELHGCDFDHKEEGRRDAREKMVKPTRHLGTSFRRLDQNS
ncbi:AN1-type zinc finger protein 3 homolog isoform X2 [Littorina saxatilis]|uniref:AN1-type zinc finger protein 3 n=1 Tax=Littorina saxatilis TaxID=31220 RepID=A0AAN9BEC4_9CAEN